VVAPSDDPHRRQMSACEAQGRMVWFSIMLEAPRPGRTDAQRTCGIVLPPFLSCSSEAARESRPPSILAGMRGRPGGKACALERFAQTVPQRTVSQQQQRGCSRSTPPDPLAPVSLRSSPCAVSVCGLLSSGRSPSGSKRAARMAGGPSVECRTSSEAQSLTVRVMAGRLTSTCPAQTLRRLIHD